MGLFDDLSGQLGNLMGGGGTEGLINSAMQMLGGSGGLNGIVEMFNKAGLSKEIQSWISKGENLPISGEQIKNVFSGDALNTISGLLGTNASGAAEMLANFLPGVIDKMTPNGKIE